MTSRGVVVTRSVNAVRITLRISRGAALRAVGWMRVFDDDLSSHLTRLPPPVPICPCTSGDPRPWPEISAGVVTHTQMDHLGNVIGDAEKTRDLLLMIEMESRPSRTEAA